MYPADLDVDYPDHFSLGLVLVKWWLLAIPHYVIITICSPVPAAGAVRRLIGILIEH